MNHARRQDLAAVGPKTRWRGKNQKGAHFLKIRYWMYAATRGQTWNGGAQISNGGGGHRWPPAGDGPDVNRDHPRTLVIKAQRNQLSFVVHWFLFQYTDAQLHWHHYSFQTKYCVLRFQTIPTPSHSRKHHIPQFEKIVSIFDITNKRVFNDAGRMLLPGRWALTDKGFEAFCYQL